MTGHSMLVNSFRREVYEHPVHSRACHDRKKSGRSARIVRLLDDGSSLMSDRANPRSRHCDDPVQAIVAAAPATNRDPLDGTDEVLAVAVSGAITAVYQQTTLPRLLSAADSLAH
jgi:hypothetical protein